MFEKKKIRVKFSSTKKKQTFSVSPKKVFVTNNEDATEQFNRILKEKNDLID